MTCLFSWLEERADEGRKELADTMRILIFRQDPDLLAVLPFDDQETFLDPSLFAFFAGNNQKDLTLGQLLFDKLPDEVTINVAVRTDSKGKIFLPRLGTLESKERGDLQLSRADDSSLSLKRQGGRVCHSLYAAMIRSGIEFVNEIPAPFQFVVEGAGGPRTGYIDDSFVEIGAAAIDALREALPTPAIKLLDHVKTIIATSTIGINSFAAPACHGAIFLSLSRSPTVPELVEDIVHQGGHVMFTAASLDPSELLEDAGSEPMAPHSGNPADKRTIYDALHGLVTEVLMVSALCQCVPLTRWTDVERTELEGRLAYIAVRAIGDFSAFADLRLLTQSGAKLLELLSQTVYPLLQQHAALIESFDLSNQPYTFSHELFQIANSERIAAPCRA